MVVVLGDAAAAAATVRPFDAEAAAGSADSGGFGAAASSSGLRPAKRYSNSTSRLNPSGNTTSSPGRSRGQIAEAPSRTTWRRQVGPGPSRSRTKYPFFSDRLSLRVRGLGAEEAAEAALPALVSLLILLRGDDASVPPSWPGLLLVVAVVDPGAGAKDEVRDTGVGRQMPSSST